MCEQQNEIKDFLGNEKSTYDAGVKIYARHKTEYKQYFDNNKGAKKGSMAFNMLEQQLRRIDLELEAKNNSENSKKNSSPALNSEEPSKNTKKDQKEEQEK
jgi:hypothetical protein